MKKATKQRSHPMRAKRVSLFSSLVLLIAVGLSPQNLVEAVQKFTPTRQLRWNDLGFQNGYLVPPEEADERRLRVPRRLQRLWSRGQRRGTSLVEGVRDFHRWRGGSLVPPDRLDSMARLFVTFMGWLVSFRAVGTAMFSHRDSLFELASRVLTSDTVEAVKTIRTIIESVNDHGVIDIFKKHRTQELMGSIYAFARLQTACEVFDRNNVLNNPSAKQIDPAVLQDLIRYAPFASAAYGWKLDLATAGRLHRGDLEALVRMTGVDEDDIVKVVWESRANRPAFFLVRDRLRRRLVLSIRGTWSAQDLLTDLCCTTQEYFVQKRRHKAHSGMLTAAWGVQSMAEEIVAEELKKNPEYSLLLVGHSLGGSVAAILGQIWSQKFKKPEVYAYGPACVCPRDDIKGDRVTSVIMEGDPISALSLGHVADVSFALDKLCRNEDLRATILMRTDGPSDSFDERDLIWCNDQMEKIRSKQPGGKLYPPGRLLFLSDPDEKRGATQVAEVSPLFFRELKISHRTFDLSRHIPRLYQDKLQRSLLTSKNVQ